MFNNSSKFMKYKLSRYLLQKVSDTFGNLVSLKRFGTVPDCTASGSCRSRGCLKAQSERKKIIKKSLKVQKTKEDETKMLPCTAEEYACG